MVAAGFGAADRVKVTGDSMSGILTLGGNPPLVIPSGTSGQVLTSDSSGNVTLQASGAGVTLDSTSGDIQPLGTQAAGSSGQAARADHVHATSSVINGVTVSGTPASGKVPTCTSGSAATWQTPAGGVTLDTTSTDIQPLGVQAAGSSGQAAAADHVHATTSVINGVTVSGSPATNKTIVCTSGSAATWQTQASGVTLDTTGSHILALGSQSAGSNGLAADSGHVHPTTGVALLAGASFSGAVSTSGNLSASGTLAVTGNSTASGTLAVAKRVTSGVVGLTDASTITVDASLGNTFRVQLSASGHTMGAPSNATDGQMILFEVTQGAGAYTLSWNSIYLFTTALPAPVITATASYVDCVGFKYVSSANKWRCLAISQGYSA